MIISVEWPILAPKISPKIQPIQIFDLFFFSPFFREINGFSLVSTKIISVRSHRCCLTIVGWHVESNPHKSTVFCLVSVTVKFSVRVSVGFRVRVSAGFRVRVRVGLVCYIAWNNFKTEKTKTVDYLGLDSTKVVQGPINSILNEMIMEIHHWCIRELR